MSKEIIFSLILAFAVVLGGVALMNKSIKPISLKGIESPTKEQEPRKRKVYIRQDAEPQQETIMPRQGSRVTQAELDEALKQTSEQNTNTENVSGIKKCTLNGQVTYSHNPCPKNASATHIFINSSEGIVSPDRETVNETMRQITTENRESREQNTAVVTLIEVKKKVSPFCEDYKNQIEHLDTLARQGSSSSVTERIRQERWNVQKLQLDGNCYKRK